jgi:TP901 family phage tail tape measure protein
VCGLTLFYRSCDLQNIMASIFEYIAKLRFETDSKAKLGAVQDDLKKLKDNAHVPVSVDTGKAAADVQQNVRSVNEWKTKLKELKSERDKSEDPKKIQDLNEQIRIARDEVKNLEAPIKQTFDKETPEEFADAVEKVGKNAKAASSGNFDQLRNLFAGGAIAAGVKEAIQAGSAYQANVAELSAITGVGGAALDDLSNRARRAALEMGGSAQGNITAFKTILSRLGPDVAKTPAALDAMSRAVGTLSRATGDTAEASVDALTTSVLQFQVPLDDAAKAAGEMTRMMNVLAAGAKEGAAEVPQVAEAIKVAGVAASGAKVSFEETNAAIQALAAGGKIGAEAGTALRNVLGKLGEGRFLPKDVQAELKAANVDINKLGDTSLTLTERMRELQKIQGDAALMTKLFGTENSAAASILLRSVDSIDELKEKITGTNTATEQAAVRQATFAATMERVQAAIGDVAITFFDTISPALTAIAGAAGDVLGFLGQSKLAVGALGAALGTIAVFLAAGAVKQFFGTFLTGTIQSSLAILQKLIPSLVVQTATTGAATGAQLALNTAMLAGPWAIVAGAVAVAVGAYALFAANSENLAESTEDVNNALAEYNKATEDFVATEKSAERTRKLADEYDRLSKSTAPDDQKRLTDITKELDQATQGAGIAVDNYGNAIEANTERVRAFADEQLRLSDQMRQDAWQNMLDQAAELGGKYSEASEEAERLRLTIDRQRNVGENLAAKLNLANDLQENREELSQFAKEREAAEKALLPVLREMDRSLNGQLTAERVMAQFGVRKIEEANKLLALMRQQNAALTDQQQKSEEADKPKPRTKQTEQDLLALAKQKADAAA